MTHPIRDAEIVTWMSGDEKVAGTPYKWMGRLAPFSVYPVTAHCMTREGVVEKLEALRTEAIEKHEEQVIARQELAKANKERAAAKKAAKESTQ